VRAALKKELKRKKTETAEAAKAKLTALDAGEKLPESDDDPAFPGYLLLIDEPENALHPMAARAAQRRLYKFATDPDWQVIMTTHSPYFVNPLVDHTTIVRLERRAGDHGPLERKTYRADEVTFDPETKRNLQALQQMDVGFSEVFFDSYPILVEGDTEYAAFIAVVVEENHELAGRATIVRARGKGILPGLARMLRHFRVPFSIIHDIDWPFTNTQGANGMWTTNQTIFDELQACRADGLVVRHRCSVPDFESELGGEELGKDKPLQAYLRIKGDETLPTRIAACIRGAEMAVFRRNRPEPTGTNVPNAAEEGKRLDCQYFSGWNRSGRFIDPLPRLGSRVRIPSPAPAFSTS